MNYYALAATVLGVSIAVSSKNDSARAVGSIIASVTGGVLLRPHLTAMGETTPVPIVVQQQGLK